MSLLEKLEKLLDEEKRMLLEGQYSSLATLSEIKLKLLERFSYISINGTSENVQRVIEKAKRNEALLESAQRGIKSAMMHVSEVAEGSFQSYSKEGQRAPLSKSLTLQQKI